MGGGGGGLEKRWKVETYPRLRSLSLATNVSEYDFVTPTFLSFSLAEEDTMCACLDTTVPFFLSTIFLDAATLFGLKRISGSNNSDWSLLASASEVDVFLGSFLITVADSPWKENGVWEKP